MTDKEIASKVAELKTEAQSRVEAVVKADPVWQNIQGQIGAYEAVLKGQNDDPKQEKK